MSAIEILLEAFKDLQLKSDPRDHESKPISTFCFVNVFKYLRKQGRTQRPAYLLPACGRRTSDGSLATAAPADWVSAWCEVPTTRVDELKTEQRVLINFADSLSSKVRRGVA